MMHSARNFECCEPMVRPCLAPRKLDIGVQFTAPTGANSPRATLKFVRLNASTARRSVSVFGPRRKPPALAEAQ